MKTSSRKHSPRKPAAVAVRPKRSTRQDPRFAPESTITPQNPFPIVGLGASAGGLEAFQQLLEALPDDTGMAYVLVQHMSAQQESMLAQLLGKSSRMPVREIEDGMPVEPNRVYVIPPERDVVISDGKLSLVARTMTRGLHMPIDHFLRTLADVQKGKAVGVVLSGTGSDGTLGLKAVKGEGGITFAQEPDSAAQDGMPRSAIASGSVDLVLEPALIARELARLGRHPYVTAAPPRDGPRPPATRSPASGEDQGLARVLSIIRTTTGADLSAYKRTTIERRVARRMALASIEGLEEYARHLEGRPQEVQELYQDCLITVTSFFRDPAAFEALRQALVAALPDRAPEGPLRVWVPGCATGEEAYSLAICLLEGLGQTSFAPALQVFATDVSEAALEKARLGVYPDTIGQDVSPERLRRFFTRADGSYQVSKTVRDLCVFARHDLAKDPPFSRLDLISCRNLLIYLEPHLQQRVLATFQYSLNRRGFLMLGRSETVGAFADQFTVVDKQQRIYMRSDRPGPDSFGWAVPSEKSSRPVTAMRARALITRRRPAELPGAVDQVLLALYTPAAVVVDASSKILEFRGDTAPYLQHPQGQAGLSLLRMARKGLLHDVRRVIGEARKLGVAARRENVPLPDEKKVRRVDVAAIPLPGAAGEDGCLLVTFKDRVRPQRQAELLRPAPAEHGAKPERQTVAQLRKQNAELRTELEESTLHLQTMVQEHERGSEELQSANEEVLSANEELQSINEELETAKEELQSANEELSTINQELQERNRQLGSVNDDLLNLLTSVNIPLVILGRDLRLRRFTPAAEKLFGLIHADVGRPLGELRSSFDTPQLEAEVLETIETMQTREREVVDRDGRFYSLLIRPYRTRDDKIDGAVVVLIDIDNLRRALDDANAIVETAREPLVILDADLRIERANRAFHETFVASAEETNGRLLYDLGDGQWVSVELRRKLQQVLSEGTQLDEFALEHDFPHIGRRTMVFAARRLSYLQAGKERILLAIEDRTDATRAAAERENVLALETQARERAEETDRLKDEFVATLSHELRGPLSSMAGSVHILQSGKADQDAEARARAVIERGINAQARLIDELLDYSRLVKGKLRLALRPTDLVATTEAAVQAVRAAAEAKEITLELSTGSAPAMVLGDHDRLQQIAWNLLSNAVKFTPRGGRVTVAVRAGERDVELSVSDTGKGIAPSFLSHVFERFRQADGRASRTEPGLGLGLAIARNLVEMQGGTVHAESPGEGQGATFTVTFPVPALLVATEDDETEPAASLAGDSGPHGSDSRPLQGVRLLVVEDDVDARQMLVAIFEQAGAQVRHAASAQEAIAAIEQTPPDVLTCDIGLPGEDGYSLIKRVRSLPAEQGGQVPALALTAYVTDADSRKCLDSGYDIHLAKPADPVELVRKVAGLAARLGTRATKGLVPLRS